MALSLPYLEMLFFIVQTFVKLLISEKYFQIKTLGYIITSYSSFLLIKILIIVIIITTLYISFLMVWQYVHHMRGIQTVPLIILIQIC